jgi:hypothetical protein
VLELEKGLVLVFANLFWAFRFYLWLTGLVLDIPICEGVPPFLGMIYLVDSELSYSDAYMPLPSTVATLDVYTGVYSVIDFLLITLNSGLCPIFSGL